MNRRDVLASLETAQLAHAHWLHFGKKLRNGIQLETVSPPLDPKEWTFEKWFYAKKELVKTIPDFNYIETIYQDFNLQYKLLFEKAQQFHARSTQSNTVDNRVEQEALLNHLYKQLVELSARLKKQLLVVEHNIKQMKAQSFTTKKKTLEAA